MADWPQFRGPQSAGVSAEKLSPGDPLKLAWTAALPGRGLSAPIIVGDQLFLTAASGPDQASLHVLCYQASTGKPLWQRTMQATGRTMSHEKTCVAAPTPCTDGKVVCALFSSNDLFAFDLDGNLLWLRGLTFDYANASNSLGMSQSPVIVDGVLVVQSENDSESFAAGIDLKTGVNLWKIDRPKAANWTSSVVWQKEGEPSVVCLQSSKGMLGVNPKTGAQVWNYSEGAATVPSSAVGPLGIYVPSNGVTALSPEGSTVSQLWRNEQLKPGTGSSVVALDSLFVINGTGVLVKASLKDGADSWKLRLKAPFSGSPVVAGTRLYVISERGLLQVVDLTAPEGKVVQELNLKQTVLTTPALSAGQLFARSDSELWCLK
jgi:outer membrane protein assembly factor BamB